MGINNAKHIIAEIDGIRCTIVETGASIDRAAFLTDLLRFNNLEVKELITPPEKEGDEPKYAIGVTDVVFNPVFALYDTPDGKQIVNIKKSIVPATPLKSREM